MKMTDEQFEKIGKQIFRAMEDGSLHLQQDTVGRAAVAAAAPLLLAEPTLNEWGEAGYDNKTEARIDADGKVHLSCYAVTKILSNRLASVTAKPDPAVEAVKALWLQHDGNASAEQIVAAVDKARAK